MKKKYSLGKEFMCKLSEEGDSEQNCRVYKKVKTAVFGNISYHYNRVAIFPTADLAEAFMEACVMALSPSQVEVLVTLQRSVHEETAQGHHTTLRNLVKAGLLEKSRYYKAFSFTDKGRWIAEALAYQHHSNSYPRPAK